MPISKSEILKKNECWVLHAQGRALQVNQANQNISWSTKMANKGSVS